MADGGLSELLAAGLISAEAAAAAGGTAAAGEAALGTGAALAAADAGAGVGAGAAAGLGTEALGTGASLAAADAAAPTLAAGAGGGLSGGGSALLAPSTGSGAFFASGGPLTFSELPAGAASAGPVAGNTVAPMTFEMTFPSSSGTLSGLNLDTAGLGAGPDIGSGAEAVQSGGELGTGGPSSPGWKMPSLKEMAEGATLTSALGTSGRALMTPLPETPVKSVPLPPVSRGGQGAPPVSDQLVQALLKRMAGRKPPGPMHF